MRDRHSANGRPRRRNLTTATAAPSSHLPLVPPPFASSSVLPPLDHLLSDHDLEVETGIPRSSWQKMRMGTDGPPWVRIGRLVRYRSSEWQRWKAGLPTFRSTSDTGSVPATGGP
jgi:predicted DNA-binding transcriptional regulator AlpA